MWSTSLNLAALEGRLRGGRRSGSSGPSGGGDDQVWSRQGFDGQSSPWKSEIVEGKKEVVTRRRTVAKVRRKMSNDPSGGGK